MVWDIKDKQVLITGGNAGIGKATAQELASRGARVTITSRDPGKGQVAAEEIQQAAGVAVEVANLDLSSLESVRSFAQDYLAHHDRLDVLINNAGVMAGARQTTSEGFEWTFGVNHLGPFLLTNLLTDLLVASAPSRIVTVSSGAHQSAKHGLDFDDLQMTNGYSSMKAYAASKLANILFTVELDRRLSELGVAANALHPGVVATSFGKGREGPKWMGFFMTILKPVLTKPSQGAETSVFLATAPTEDLDAGLYWSDSKPKEPIPPAANPDAAARLWTLSEQMIEEV